MLANANWFGDTFGESIGDTICAAATDGEWHRGSVGDVVAIMDLRWPRVEGRREDRLSSFCEAKQKRERALGKRVQIARGERSDNAHSKVGFQHVSNQPTRTRNATRDRGGIKP